MNPTTPLVKDEYSYSVPDEVRVQHMDLDLEVLFNDRILRGAALLTLDAPFSGDLVLDTCDLIIDSVEFSQDKESFRSATFKLGGSDPIKGAPLSIFLPQRASAVRIRYQTSPDASGLQWLTPMQTAGKEYPFLFTQSEATHARSWIPLQDTPQVRSTYAARIHIPHNLKAVMSASNNPSAFAESDPRFSMTKPIPSYLIALAVGDLEFRELSKRTGVFAERPVINRAVHEFENLDRMLLAGEDLFGPYRWGRYDVLVLPPSFPVGGMENPCLTFTTPTIIAGDKSLSSLIIHELAHSWSSNLVNNATWSDFWINEGPTVYMERRIVEKLYGHRRAEMEAVLAMQDLERELLTSVPEDQILHRGTNSRDPNIGFSLIRSQA